MNRQLALMALIGLVMFCPRTWAELVVEVTKGQDDAIPIAIVPFSSPEEAAASFDVAQLVSDDLTRSARFKSMARKDMIDQPHTGAKIGFDDWRRLSNDYILVGQLQPQGADRYNIVFELYNVLNRQRLLGYQISANKSRIWCSRRSSACAVRLPRVSPTFRCSGICRTRRISSWWRMPTARIRAS